MQSCIRFSFGSSIVFLRDQKVDRVEIALEAKAHERLDAGQTRVGDLAEVLALRHVGQMHLDCRNGDGLQRVQNGDARVRVGGGIDDDAVVNAVGGLDLVDQRTLVVGLEDFALRASRAAGVLAEADKGVIVLRTVDGRARAGRAD